MDPALVIEGISGEVLRATVWSTGDGGGYFQFELLLDPDDDPIVSIEITPDDATRLALALAGTASRYSTTH